MSRTIFRIARLACVIAVLMALAAGSASALSASVVMRVSRTAQDSVVNLGEDLAIDVELDGVEPAMYRWYFEDELIHGAESRTLGIGAAALEDAGRYRLEAYAGDGSMLASMEFNVRVVDSSLPKSGDNTLGIGAVAGAMALLMGAMAVLIVRRRRVAL